MRLVFEMKFIFCLDVFVRRHRRCFGRFGRHFLLQQQQQKQQLLLLLFTTIISKQLTKKYCNIRQQ